MKEPFLSHCLLLSVSLRATCAQKYWMETARGKAEEIINVTIQSGDNKMYVQKKIKHINRIVGGVLRSITSETK